MQLFVTVADEHLPVATALATIIVSRDPQRLGAALTETVRLRAPLPGGPIRFVRPQTWVPQLMGDLVHDRGD